MSGGKTMLGTRFATGFVLALGLSALAGTARAGDTFRLDMPGPGRAPAIAPDSRQDTRTLDQRATDTSADLLAASYRGYHGGFYGGGYRGYHGGYYGGGYRGYYGGGYRGYYGGGYRGYYGGGYRGYYGGGYRGYYGGGYGGGYRGYYGGGYGGYGHHGHYGHYPRYYGSYYPRYYGGYYPSYYGGYYPSYYGGYYPSYYGSGFTFSFSTPIVYSTPSYYLDSSVPLSITTIPQVEGRVIESRVIESSPTTTNPLPPSSTVPPAATMPPADSSAPESRTEPGTYRYDGGPKDPVPMPRIEEPTPTSYDMVIRPARLVSLPEVATPASKSGKWVLPAFGEEARRQPTRTNPGR